MQKMHNNLWSMKQKALVCSFIHLYSHISKSKIAYFPSDIIEQCHEKTNNVAFEHVDTN